MKDGGLESTVTGYWLIEYKPLISIVLLKFEGQSREAFHSHAFNCISWLLAGFLLETFIDGTKKSYEPSAIPFITRRTDFHRVDSIGTSWVFSIRGPWIDKWHEKIGNKFIGLTHGRIEV